MERDKLYFFLLNIGHFLDHLFMLLFATVAALALYREWGGGFQFEAQRYQASLI